VTEDRAPVAANLFSDPAAGRISLSCAATAPAVVAALEHAKVWLLSTTLSLPLNAATFRLRLEAASARPIPIGSSIDRGNLLGEPGRLHSFHHVKTHRGQKKRCTVRRRWMPSSSRAGCAPTRRQDLFLYRAERRLLPAQPQVIANSAAKTTRPSSTSPRELRSPCTATRASQGQGQKWEVVAGVGGHSRTGGPPPTRCKRKAYAGVSARDRPPAPTSNLFGCVFRVRSRLAFAIHQFFRSAASPTCTRRSSPAAIAKAPANSSAVTTLDLKNPPKRGGRRDRFSPRTFLRARLI